MNLFNELKESVNSMVSIMRPYAYIKANTKTLINFEKSAYIYYLFNDNDLIYIGKTEFLPDEISEHIKNGKIFNKIYYEERENIFLSYLEKLYIYRDSEKINNSIIEEKELLLTMLNNIDNRTIKSFIY
jgi:hypothetical protein